MILNSFTLYQIYTKVPELKNSILFESIKNDVDRKLKEYEEYVNRAGCSSCAKKARLGDVGNFILKKTQPVLENLVKLNPEFFKTLAQQCKEKGVMLASDNIIVVVLKDKNGKPLFHRIHI